MEEEARVLRGGSRALLMQIMGGAQPPPSVALVECGKRRELLWGGAMDDVVSGAVRVSTQAPSKGSGQQSQARAWRISTASNKLRATPSSRGPMLKPRGGESSSAMNFI